MISLTIDGHEVSVERGTTLLEAARFLRFDIPTLCHLEGLSPYGACRLCVVELGEGRDSPLVSACTYRARDGLEVRTSTARVLRARKMVIELLVASCPQSKTIQDLAAAHDVRQQRFRQEFEDCICCGLCVRMCEEQMMSKAIGFRGRGQSRSVGTPFDMRSDVCRLCGGCIYVCPVCELRCTNTDPERVVCGACTSVTLPSLAPAGFNAGPDSTGSCLPCEHGSDNERSNSDDSDTLQNKRLRSHAH
ncbi:MAG: 2Fe-2S iron-sulfur cluster-binding protein [Planctomycetota bacterium]|jgi:coenzyme F420 hydrogenase subunit beta